MTSQRTHYEVLGVSATATTDQIKKKYREMARKFHPDVVKDKAMGQKIFTQVNQAYRVLADPERRAQYDASLRADRGQAAEGPIAAGTAGGARPNGAGVAGGAPPQAGPLTPQQTQAVSRSLSDADFAMMNANAPQAQAHCEAALKIDPRNARGWALLGDALSTQGKREEAIRAYRQSLQITPSPMVQAKLKRLEGGDPPGGAGTRTNPPGGTRPPTIPPGGAAKPSGAADKSSGGLLGRLLGKKK